MPLYFLYKKFDSNMFELICEEVEKTYNKYIKKERLIDVDNSIVQIYQCDNDEIVLVNDASNDIIRARATVDLWNFKYTFAKSENGRLIKK